MASISQIQGIPEGIYWGDRANVTTNPSEAATFDSLLQSAMDLVNETNSLSNKVEEEEIRYAMGMADSPLDLMLAQQKANISLQYTVSVRNTIMDAYKEIMNLQF